MNKLITKLAVLAMGAASVMGVSSSDIGSIKASAEIQPLSTFEILTSVADIDPTATYIFGADDPADTRFEGMAYHYDTSGVNWGLVRSIDLGVFEYTLTAVDASARTFTASYVNSGGTVTYLNITGTANRFHTSTSSATLALGREEGQSMVYNTGLTRSYQYNASAGNTTYGLRHYGDTTGTAGSGRSYAAFYKVVPPSGGDVSTEGLGKAYINRLTALIEKGNTLSLAKTDEAEVNNIIAQFNGTAATGNLTEAVKNYVIEQGYNDATMTALLLSYNTSIVNELYLRVNALAPADVTQADERTIQGFATEYGALNEAQQRIADDDPYFIPDLIDALNAALDAAFVNPVADLIEALPEASAITTAADWSLYDAAVTEAKNAYDALGTRQSLVSQTLVAKLNDVIAAMDAVKPALTEASYQFSSTGATGSANAVVYPEGWSGNAVPYFSTLASFQNTSAYVQMDSLLPVNVKSISNLVVTVYAVTHHNSNISTITVHGLNNGEKIEGCSQLITPISQTINATTAPTVANANPRIASLSSETLINGIRLECTTKTSNIALIGVDVSYVVSDTYSDEYVSLVNDITELNTCTAYVNAAEYRARYDALAADEKADFDAKLIKDNDTSGAEVSVTCGAKLAYLEYLVENPPVEVSTGSSIINNAKEQTPVTLIVLVAVLGLSAVTAYYFINKKKLQA